MNVYKQKTIHIALSLVIVATFVAPSQMFANDLSSVDSVDSAVSTKSVSVDAVVTTDSVDRNDSSRSGTRTVKSRSNVSVISLSPTATPCAAVPCKADLNKDGIVNDADLLIVIGTWTGTPTSAIKAKAASCSTTAAELASCKSAMTTLASSLTVDVTTNKVDLRGDVNGDGIVNVTDLLAVISAWGKCPKPPVKCPTPTTPVPPTPTTPPTTGGNGGGGNGGGNGGNNNNGEVLGVSDLPGLPDTGTGASAVPLFASISAIFGTLGLLGAKKLMVFVK